MKPPFRYYGGKQRLAREIILRFPAHDTYVEPFAGSASVLFAKAPVRHEAINDLSGGVVSFFRTLRDRPDDLVEVCRLTPYAIAEFRACRDIYDEAIDDLERARRFFVRVSQGFGGTSRPSTGWSSSVLDGSNRANVTQNYVDRFHEIAARLRRVVIDQRPATKVVDLYGTASAVIYADPPYLGSTRTQHSKSSGGYDVEMLDESEHIELAEALHRTPATVFLSGYHSELYDDLYAGWDLIEFETTSPVAGGDPRTEVLWSNRPIAVQRQEVLAL